MNASLSSVAPSATGRARAGRVVLILALAFHLSLLFSWRLGFWNAFTFDSVATHGRRGWDFYALYQAGHNVLTGASAYESDNHRIDVVVPLYTPFRYLPVSAYTLGVALNALSPLWAYRLWVAFVEITLLACAYLSWRVAPGRRGAVLAAMWLCFTPYYLEIYLGQFTLVQSALVLLMMVAASTEWPAWRRAFGPAWIASLLWKQNTALFAPLLLRQGRWRLLFGAGLAVTATSAPYFVTQPGSLQAFLGNLASGAPAPQLGNLGVRQFLYSLASALAPGLSTEGHIWLQRGWVAVVLAAGLWLTLRDRRPNALLHLCLWTTTYLLVYHHVWEHHYVLALPVLVMLYRRDGSPLLLALYALMALWTPYILVDPQGLAAYHEPMRWTPLEPRIADVLYHASKALPAVALWGYIARAILRRAAARQSVEREAP